MGEYKCQDKKRVLSTHVVSLSFSREKGDSERILPWRTVLEGWDWRAAIGGGSPAVLSAVVVGGPRCGNLKGYVVSPSTLKKVDIEGCFGEVDDDGQAWFFTVEVK